MQGFHYEFHIAKNPINNEKDLNDIAQHTLKNGEQMDNQEILTNIYNKQQKYLLQLPIVPIIFIYWFDDKSDNIQNYEVKPHIQIEVQFEEVSKNRKIRYKVIDAHTIQHKNTANISLIYQSLQLEISQSYSVDVMMAVSIKFSDSSTQYQQFAQIKDLSEALSKRNIGIYEDKVHSVIKQSFVFKEPMKLTVEYKKEIGCLWIQIENEEDQTQLVIHKIQLLNSLVLKNPVIKKFISEMVPKNYFDSAKMLKPSNAIAIIFTFPKNIENVRIPYSLQYSIPSMYPSTFTMTSYIPIN